MTQVSHLLKLKQSPQLNHDDSSVPCWTIKKDHKQRERERERERASERERERERLQLYSLSEHTGH